MTRVLIVDDDASSRAYVREMAPPGWEWSEAADGLSGVAAFLQLWPRPDLVVLDIMLPDTDGHWVCARIREESRDVRILPFTANLDAVATIERFACLPALTKPARPEQLQATLARALDLPTDNLTMSPLAAWVVQESVEALRKAAAALDRQQAVVYASDTVVRTGLVTILSPQVRVSEAGDRISLRGALAAPGVSVLVAPGADYEAVRDTAQRYKLPLVLVADTVEQAKVLRSVGIAAVLLGSDAQIQRRLRGVVRALMDDLPVDPFVSLPETVALTREIVPPDMLERFAGTGLREREKEVLWLLSRGLTQVEIATYLKITPSTVKSHVQNAQETLQMDRAGLERWMRERLA